MAKKDREDIAEDKLKRNVTGHLKKDSKTWDTLSKSAKKESKDDKSLIKKVKKMRD